MAGTLRRKRADHRREPKRPPPVLADMIAPLRPLASLALAASLCACQSAPPQAPNAMANDATPAPANIVAPPATPSPAPEADPRSPEAAVAIVRDYYALIEARRFDEAAALISPAPDPRTLETRFGGFAAIGTQVGGAGDGEGAAGSIYITVPARLTVTRQDGTRAIIAEKVTLRRVNDVPGSTEEQRRWHITAVAPTADDAQ